MAKIGAVPLSLLGIVFLFLPGIIAVDLYYLVSKKKNPLSRSQRLIYSAGISTASILILYLATPIYFQFVSSLLQDAASQLNIVTENEIQGLTLPVILGLYIGHALIAALIGVVAGAGNRRFVPGNSDRREPWQYSLDQAEDDENVEVVLRNNDTIHGRIDSAALDSSQRELFLNDPKDVRYDMYNNDIIKSSSLGRSVLLSSQTISHIVFLEQDPESRMDTRGQEENRRQASDEVTDFMAQVTIESEATGRLDPKIDTEGDEEVSAGTDPEDGEDPNDESNTQGEKS